MEAKRLDLNGTGINSHVAQAAVSRPVSKSAVNPVDPSSNAILVNKELLSKVLNELKARLPVDHRMPDARDVVDWCVREMGDQVVGAYSAMARREFYKWFGSDVAKSVQLRNDIVDKGKFVDACIIACVYGEAAFTKFCRGLPVAILPPISADEKTKIKQYAAEMAAMKGQEVGVRPAPSFPESENS